MKHYMRHYKTRRWNLILAIIAIIIFPLLVWYSNSLVDKIVKEEHGRIRIWAGAIQRRANLVNYSRYLFSSIAQEEEEHVRQNAKAFVKVNNAQPGEDLTFYLEFIQGNKTIPLILVDEDGNITTTLNLDSDYAKRIDTPEKLAKVVAEEKFILFPVNYHDNRYFYLYYKESSIYTGLKEYFVDLSKSFFTEIVDNAPSLSVIVTDSLQEEIIISGNVDTTRIHDSLYAKKLIKSMKAGDNPPIKISIGNTSAYVFYEESGILKTMRLFPVILILLFGLFITVAYLLFRFARRSERNQIWVGMSKETAHQLGTPLSSLMAWTEILKNENVNPDILEEINKDIICLENITQRFSKIGSIPKLEKENVNEVVSNFISYFKNRTSSKINFNIQISHNKLEIEMNKHLFEWVLENLCKNAVDAMNGKGTISILIHEDAKYVYIDISDTGKGIESRNQKSIFEAGFTTKSRGWGLGLTLSRRIINEYHRGKIILKNSTLDKGSTFRMKLRKNEW